MPKWIDEKVLQRYFLENCSEYTFVIKGEEYPISSCRFNEPFDRFPDCFCIINGDEYPVEVEWLSSHYDHHISNAKQTETKPYTHQKFVDNNGFLVVLEKDCEVFNFKQIVLDNTKVKKWFVKKANDLFDESVKQFTSERHKQREHARIWLIYVSKQVNSNWVHSKNDGNWGFTEGRLKTNKDIRDIKANDIVIFFGPVHPGAYKLRGWPRVSDNELKKVSKKKDYIISKIEIFRISQDYYNEKESDDYKPIWPDENKSNQLYPHRFRFDSNTISTYNNVSFDRLNFYTLRKVRDAIRSSPIEIDYSNFVELLRYYK